MLFLFAAEGRNEVWRSFREDCSKERPVSQEDRDRFKVYHGTIARDAHGCNISFELPLTCKIKQRTTHKLLPKLSSSLRLTNYNKQFSRIKQYTVRANVNTVVDYLVKSVLIRLVFTKSNSAAVEMKYGAPSKKIAARKGRLARKIGTSNSIKAEQNATTMAGIQGVSCNAINSAAVEP
ncbi:unnamed protein product [Arctia plantaginis]|uniref:Uncharacterized protein n=1 Tax=Arctia plantaginis TaxID=874455 RepID=A0A8S0ZXM8_ARCPL|nr:unnamed protein product [Arctia plantaginis]